MSSVTAEIAAIIARGETPPTPMTHQYLNETVKSRIMFLDGGMGTRIQAEKLTEEQYRGERFKTHKLEKCLKGNNDLLNLTQPDIITDIHAEYLDAGSDMIETNTFNCTKASMEDYDCCDIVYELNVQAAKLAKAATARVTKQDMTTPRFVCGAIGPTSKTLSVSPSVEDPSYRASTFDELVEGYKEQVGGLIDGGCDIILIETIFDTMNAKAAAFAFHEYFEEVQKPPVPLMVSVTITDNSGRNLSGQMVEAFYTSIAHAKPFSVGINCALGATVMLPFYDALHRVNETWCSIYANAGLPNAFGGYDETPEIFANNMMPYAERQNLNIVGGCCGTFPSHIAAVKKALGNATPRVPPVLEPKLRLSGLEPFEQINGNFTNIGERCNLLGSRKFKRLIEQNKWDDALEIAREQVENGAQILDFNFDTDLLDGVSAMGKFMRLCVTDPLISKVPFVIDSSKWDVIEEGLKWVQGKCIVNSTSLKNGEERFLKEAKCCMKHGAALVCMAFDEEGQAVTREEKVRISMRMYNLLKGIGFNMYDVIYDVNVLTIATGLPEHNGYGLDFILAVEDIHKACPEVSFSGGLSNLSFSFRGLDELREAMHSCMLYLAIPRGLNMSIVNAGMLPVFDDIPKEMRDLCCEVIMNSSPNNDHVERILAMAEEMAEKKKAEKAAGGGAAKVEEVAAWRNLSVQERITHALVKGIDKHIVDDCKEVQDAGEKPLNIIEGPLMNGMNVVGDLFGSGKMFLPQVIKSARVMKKAVGYLTPFMEEEKKAAILAAGGDPNQPTYAGKVLLATVKGDVHDIGKNIVGVVLGCNNYQVIDIGVMVPCQKILDVAKEEGVDVIGVSGLITPSLDEMVHIAKEMEAQGFKQPLLVGGATTSKRHAAVKLAPKSKKAIHVLDASRAVPVVQQLIGSGAQDYLDDIQDEYDEIRTEYYEGLVDKKWLSIEKAQSKSMKIDFAKNPPPKPITIGNIAFQKYDLNEIRKYIDWGPFFSLYNLRGKYPNKGYPNIFKDETCGAMAKQMFDEANEMMDNVISKGLIEAHAVVGIWPARRVGDDIICDSPTNEPMTFYGLRQQQDMDQEVTMCHSDFVAEEGDHIGAFACSCGVGVEKMKEEFHARGEVDQAILLDAVADRLSEAYAELIHVQIRKQLWGYAPDEDMSLEDMLKVKYQGIRPAPGYPSQPDHREKKTLFDLLEVEKLLGGRIGLTDSYMMLPAAAVCALVFAHPEAEYFNVGQVNKDQVIDYSKRMGVDVAETERWLGATVLGYDA